jgi:hypothetical protein
MTPERFVGLITSMDRRPEQRTTSYGRVGAPVA